MRRSFPAAHARTCTTASKQTGSACCSRLPQHRRNGLTGAGNARVDGLCCLAGGQGGQQRQEQRRAGPCQAQARHRAGLIGGATPGAATSPCQLQRRTRGRELAMRPPELRSRPVTADVIAADACKAAPAGCCCLHHALAAAAAQRGLLAPLHLQNVQHCMLKLLCARGAHPAVRAVARARF